MKKCRLCNSPAKWITIKDKPSKYKRHIRNWGAQNPEMSFMVERQTKQIDLCEYHYRLKRLGKLKK
jgi:hypothetical protein